MSHASVALKSSASNQALLEVAHLYKSFPLRGSGIFGEGTAKVHALQDVSLTIDPREIVGLVGESGSGKSTLGRAVMRLIEADEGRILFEGENVLSLHRSKLGPFRRKAQMIFQDPYASLDPKMSIEATLSEPLAIHRVGDGRKKRREQVAALLTQVGLSPDFMSRYPHQFSGGQRQRIAIARALILKPRLVIADEPVSALDVSVQAQVLNLIQDLQLDLGLAILFISHDLNVVSYLCHRVVVLYLGRVMEVASSRQLFAAPKHPYTEALLSAAPGTEAQSRSNRIVLRGELPSPSNPPSGCVFRTRCPYAIPDCARVVPELREAEPGHFKACIRDAL